jgi:transcriptional regulator
MINHYPVLLDPSKGLKGRILGHMAKGNSQWRSWQSDTKVTCIFNGPNRYISPAWYQDALNVPTWNYAVVHMTGTPRLIEDLVGIESILEALVNKYESLEGSNWKYTLPEDFKKGLIQAIVGFEIEVSEIEAKFKLSQNREDVDRQGVIDALSIKTDESSREMLGLIKAHWKK